MIQEDDHFVFNVPKTDEQNISKKKTIIGIEKDKGVEQYSTR